MRLLDAGSETLFMLVMIYDKVCDELFYDQHREDELCIDLTVKTATRAFESTLKMYRNLNIEDKAANHWKYLLISFSLQTGAARYQLLEPVLSIGRIVQADDSWITSPAS